MSYTIHVFSWEEKVWFLREGRSISIAKQSIEYYEYRMNVGFSDRDMHSVTFKYYRFI